MIDPKTTLMDRLAFVAGIFLLFVYVFTVSAPYLLVVHGDNLIRDIEQNQNTTQNLLLITWGFLFGNSLGKRTADKTLSDIASNSQDNSAPDTLTVTAPAGQHTTVSTGAPDSNDKG